MVFWHLLEHLEYGKKLMDTATKTEIEVAKNASKKSCLKKEEATEKLVANKTGGKIISAGSTKKKKKKKIRRRWIKWNTKNLYTSRKTSTNYWYFKIFLDVMFKIV